MVRTNPSSASKGSSSDVSFGQFTQLVVLYKKLGNLFAETGNLVENILAHADPLIKFLAYLICERKILQFVV